MKLDFAGLTDIGNVRTVNQDAFYIDPQGRFFIVADGMGGHAGGQEASQIAAQTITDYLNSHWDHPDPSALLKDALIAANQAIVRDQHSHPERSDMGTTAVVVLFRETGQTWCANVGDSRVYQLRGEDLQQITEDQTWVAQAVQRQVLTTEEARVHPWRHVLSQCLGREDLSFVEIEPMEVKACDRLLLCSDGLTEELADETIAEQLKLPESCEQIASLLIKQAKQGEGRDNITVIVISVEPTASVSSES